MLAALGEPDMGLPKLRPKFTVDEYLAIERVSEFKPYRIVGPVELKMEFTTRGTHNFSPGPGVEQLDDRTWVFRGKDVMEAWLKYSSF